jgi:hypothetical protein
MTSRVIPKQWVDMKTGELTREAMLYLNDLDNNSETGITNIGTRLSGVSLKTDGIIAGTQPLADVTLTGVGSLKTQQEAQDSAVNGVATVAGGGGGLTGYASKSSVGGTRVGAGSVTSATVTVTASGGTAPYTYAWTKISGGAITAVLPASDVTAFSGTVALGETISAQFQCTITDDVAATFVVGPIGVGLSEIS